MERLTDADVAILEVLKTKARLSTREIGKVSGIPAGTVYKRLKLLEEKGIIEGYSAIINKEKLGKKTIAYVLIRATPGADQNDIINAALKYDIVEDIAAIAGPFDIILKVRVHDTDELSEFLFKEVRNFKSVAHTESLIALNLKSYTNGKKK